MRMVFSTGRKGTLYHVPSSRLLAINLVAYMEPTHLLPVVQSLFFQYSLKRIFCLCEV